MARRRTKKRGKAALVAWNEAHQKIFRIGAGMTPPSHVRVSQTLRGLVFSAKFKTEDGLTVVARTRIAASARTGELYVADESMTFSALITGGGA